MQNQNAYGQPGRGEDGIHEDLLRLNGGGKVDEWVQSWVEYFRQDAVEVEDQLQYLCSRLRRAASALEDGLS